MAWLGQTLSVTYIQRLHLRTYKRLWSECSRYFCCADRARTFDIRHPGFLLKYFYFLAYIFMELYYEFQVLRMWSFPAWKFSHCQGNSTSLAKKARLSFAGHGV
jgi:hypothetical protein